MGFIRDEWSFSSNVSFELVSLSPSHRNPKEVRHCYNGERDFSASLPFSSFNFLKNVRSLLNVRTRTLIHESFPRFHIYSV